MGLAAELHDIDLKSTEYIRDLVFLIKKDFGLEKILSIILFGSQAYKKNENTHISDCDVLIIIKDDVSEKKLKNLEKYFCSLEIKHKFREFNNSFSKKIMDVIQRSTGMFVSHFITSRRNWVKGVFHKIFNVNQVFSALFAPSKIVLSSVVDNSLVLHGTDLRSNLKRRLEIPSTDMIKSIVMNVIISIFSIAISPFKNLKAFKYQLEAVKWSLRASNYFLFKDSAPLKKIVNRFSMLENPKSRKKTKSFFSRFLELRTNPKTDIKFALQIPLKVLKIHLKAIYYNNSTVSN